MTKMNALVRPRLSIPMCEPLPASLVALSHDEQIQLFIHLLKRGLQFLKPQIQLHKQFRDNQVIVIFLASDTTNIRGWDPIEFVWWLWFRQHMQRSMPACWTDMPLKSGAVSVITDCSYGRDTQDGYDPEVRRQLLEVCEPYLIEGSNAS